MLTADVVVVGLGAMGSATLYQLARRGARVIGIDRFAPPHDRGSSHGESRITRLAIGEGEEYVPFALRSHELWRELEAQTGESLLVRSGGLLIGQAGNGVRHHGRVDFVGRTMQAAKRFAIAHEVLDADEVGKRFPPFQLRGDEVCYYEPDAGFLRPERCIAAHLHRARQLGAIVRTGETVSRIESDRVITDVETYSAAQLVVTAGAWMGALLGEPFSRLLTVYPQTLYWFAPDDAASFVPERFPIFIWIHGASENGYFYGLPIVADGVKLATEQFSTTADPDTPRAVVTSAESAPMYATHVRGRLAGVSARCTRTMTCLYTVTPDSRFIIDGHPQWARVLVASPCSGHGFKHSAAIGEALAQRVLEGNSRLDLTSFSLARFAGDSAR
jgi:sarcosine oxidase